MKIVGAKIAWQKQNKKLFSCQKFQHTNEDDNTNAHSVEKNLGCKAEDHLQNQFIDKKLRSEILFCKKCMC